MVLNIVRTLLVKQRGYAFTMGDIAVFGIGAIACRWVRDKNVKIKNKNAKLWNPTPKVTFGAGWLVLSIFCDTENIAK